MKSGRAGGLTDRHGREHGPPSASRWLLPVLGMLLCGNPLIAQSARPGGDAPAPKSESSQSLPDVPRVALEEITGAPGDSLMMPLRFSPGSRTELSRLTVDVRYISNSLQFVKLSPAVEEDKAGFTTDLDITAPDDKGLRHATLHITVAAPEKNAERKVPAGLLAFLLFDISADAKPRPITLDLSVASAEDTKHPPRPVTPFAADPGLVTVVLGDVVPEISCFFYMH